MENNKSSKIFVTDGYKVEHKKFIDKLMFNTYYPSLPAPYIFHDPSVAEKITEEARMIQNSVIKNIEDNLIVISAGADKSFLHHTIPTHHTPIMNIHDILEDRIGDFPKISEKITRKILQLSDIIVSLQSNNQKIK